MSRQLVVLLAMLSFAGLGCSAGDGGGGGGGGDGITVTGEVRSAYGGTLANIQVLVGDELVTSDAAGAFTVEDVEVPYSIVAFDPTPDGYLVGYIGATREDPIVVLSSANAREGSVDVTLSPA